VNPQALGHGLAQQRHAAADQLGRIDEQRRPPGFGDQRARRAPPIASSPSIAA
jgi:hypothetical protein